MHPALRRRLSSMFHLINHDIHSLKTEWALHYLATMWLLRPVPRLKWYIQVNSFQNSFCSSCCVVCLLLSFDHSFTPTTRCLLITESTNSVCHTTYCQHWPVPFWMGQCLTLCSHWRKSSTWRRKLFLLNACVWSMNTEVWFVSCRDLSHDYMNSIVTFEESVLSELCHMISHQINMDMTDGPFHQSVWLTLMVW